MSVDHLHSSPELLEECAELYVLGRMTRPERVSYEEHLLICEACREAVTTVEEFIEVFRHAVSHRRAMRLPA